jgi:hypothetical protein
MADYNDLWELDRQDYVAIVTELRAELEQVRHATNNLLCILNGDGGHALTGDIISDISAATDAYYRKVVEVDERTYADFERSRRTIAALVRAARAMGHVARVWRSEDVEWSWVLEDARARIAYMQDRQAEAERQAKEG